MALEESKPLEDFDKPEKSELDEMFGSILEEETSEKEEEESEKEPDKEVEKEPEEKVEEEKVETKKEDLVEESETESEKTKEVEEIKAVEKTTEEVEKDKEKEQEPVKETETEEVLSDAERLDAMRKTMSEMLLAQQTGVKPPVNQQQQPEQAQVQPPPPVQAQPVKVPDTEFLSEESWKGIEENGFTREGMNAILTQVQREAYQSAIREIVPATNQMINHQVALQLKVSDFYQANQDLVGFKPTVGAVTMRLQKEHPEWSYEQLFESLGQETRKMLQLDVVQKQQTVRKNNPALPTKIKGKTNSAGPKKLSDLQVDLNELK